MIKLRQAIQDEHPKKRSGCGKKNSELKGYRNERRPTKRRPTPHIQPIVEYIGINLHQETRRTPQKSSDQSNQSDRILTASNPFRKSIDRKRRVSLNPAVPGGANPFRCLY